MFIFLEMIFLTKQQVNARRARRAYFSVPQIQQPVVVILKHVYHSITENNPNGKEKLNILNEVKQQLKKMTSFQKQTLSYSL